MKVQTKFPPPSPGTSTELSDNRLMLEWRRLHLKRSKLRASAKTSALLAGFAMVAMVEVQFNNDPDNPVPPALLIIFGICTVLLVSVHMLALMIATCILPSVDAVYFAAEIGHANPSDSPHDKMDAFIEIAYTFSNVFGIFLFLIEVAILCWAKFWEMGQPEGQPGKRAALASTVILVPVLVLFVAFAIFFYRKLVKHNYDRLLHELETINTQFEITVHEETKKINRNISNNSLVFTV